MSLGVSAVDMRALPALFRGLIAASVSGFSFEARDAFGHASAGPCLFSWSDYSVLSRAFPSDAVERAGAAGIPDPSPPSCVSVP